MGNRFGTDILIQAKDPKVAAEFYVRELGFEVTEERPEMISLHGPHINFFIERGPSLGPVLEVSVPDLSAARARLTQHGCKVVKDEPKVPRVYIQDPFGLIYNLTE